MLRNPYTSQSSCLLLIHSDAAVWQVTLEVNNSEAAARIVKARLERTTLGQVAKRIRATLRPVSSMAVRTASFTSSASL